MKSIRTFLILLALSLFSGCSITHSYGPYQGKVVDAETKEPIEGAAVLVVFYTEEPGIAGSITRYADAVETVTDKNGEFMIPAHRVTVFRPLQGWDKYGYLTIFKPGYGCYPRHKNVKPMLVPNETLPGKKFVTIELPKIITREERIETTHCAPPSHIPYDKAKKLIDIINQENKALGLGIEKYD